jgi:hypothetical protein
LPKDDEGRVLDYKTRHMIHDILIQVSWKNKWTTRCLRKAALIL